MATDGSPPKEESLCLSPRPSRRKTWLSWDNQRRTVAERSRPAYSRTLAEI